MHFVAESVPGEITLMFISYLLFCTVLMYLFVKTDREWGRMEVALDEPAHGQEAVTASAMLFSSTEIGGAEVTGEEAARQSLRHCTEHHALNCTCFLQVQRNEPGPGAQ